MGIDWHYGMTTTTPTPCSFGCLQYMPAVGLVLLNTASYPAYEQYSTSTYIWNGSNNWTLQVPVATNKPSYRTDTMMAYDTTTSKLTQVGGRNLPGLEFMNDVNTYASGATTWANVLANYQGTGPTIRAKSMMAAMSNGVALFGGISEFPWIYQDLWFYAGASGWTNLIPTTLTPTMTSPAVRYNAAFASNAAGGAGTTAVLFGGQGYSNLLNDLWTLTSFSSSGGTWTQQTATGNIPSCRSGAAFCWSNTNSVYYLFGGQDSSGNLLNDTYSLSTSWVWTKLTPTNSPSVRTGAMMASDGSTQTLLFGGRNSKLDLQDTWLWTSNNWVQQ